MQAIQTYLSPSHCNTRSEGFRWTAAKYRCYSYALSCMQLVKFHPDVTLITDKRGKELLIDTFNLPYRDVLVVLDDILNELPAVSEGLAKVFSWTVPQDQFFFVDETVYLWKSLDLVNLNLDVFAFDEDKNNDEVLRGLFKLQDLCEYLPVHLLSEGKQKISMSTRITGGNPRLFSGYYSFVKEFLHDPLLKDRDLNILTDGAVDPLFLNYFFAGFCQQISVRVHTLHNVAVDDRQFTPFKVFEPLGPHSLSYIPNGLKSDFNTQCNLSFIVETLYPDVHKRITNYFNEIDDYPTSHDLQPWTQCRSKDFFVRTRKAMEITSLNVSADGSAERLTIEDIESIIHNASASVESKLVLDAFEFEKAKFVFYTSAVAGMATDSYKRRMDNYRRLFLTAEVDASAVKFIRSESIHVIESAWKWGIHTNIQRLYPLRVIYNHAMPEGYYQTLLWRNPELKDIAEYDLEQLEMIILHLLVNPSSLDELFDGMGEYFEEGRDGVAQIRHVALSRFKELVFMGAIEVIV